MRVSSLFRVLAVVDERSLVQMLVCDLVVDNWSLVMNWSLVLRSLVMS